MAPVSNKCRSLDVSSVPMLLDQLMVAWLDPLSLECAMVSSLVQQLLDCEKDGVLAPMLLGDEMA